MKRFLRQLRSELKRSVFTLRFLLATLGFALLCCINLPRETWPSTVPYCFSCGFGKGFYFSFLVCAAIPGSTGFLSESEDGYLVPLMQRITSSEYCAAKVLACACSGALVVLLGMGLYLAYLFLRFPMTSDVVIDFSGWARLVNQGRTGLYIAVLTWFTALCGGVFAVLALTASCWLKNSYATLCFPLLFYYLLCEIASALQIPYWLYLDVMKNIPLFPDSIIGSVLYFTAYLLLLGLLAGVWFDRRVRRLQENGYRT